LKNDIIEFQKTTILGVKMEENITVGEITDHLLWDDFVETSPQGTVFSSSAWLKASSSAYGGRPVFFGAKEHGELVAGVTYVEITKGPFKRATTPILTPYGGLLYSGNPDLNNDSLRMVCTESIIRRLQKKYDHVFLVNAPGLDDIRSFLWQNWEEKVKYTYRLDLDGTESIWNKFRKSTQKHLRRAEETLKVEDSADIGRIGELYRRALSERGKTGTPEAMSMKMVSLLIESGIAIAAIAVENGADAALLVRVSDSNSVYAWVGGTLPDKSHLYADSFLIWDIIKRYSGKIKRFDLMGANIPSVAWFKKGFGGVLTPYYVTECYSSKTVRTAFNLYSGIRKLIGR
jgi:hypothetical protein